MCRCSSQANKESFSSISCLFGYDPFPINAENFSQSSSLYISKMRNPGHISNAQIFSEAIHSRYTHLNSPNEGFNTNQIGISSRYICI